MAMACHNLPTTGEAMGTTSLCRRSFYHTTCSILQAFLAFLSPFTLSLLLYLFQFLLQSVYTLQ